MVSAVAGVPREVMELVEYPLSQLLTGLFRIPGHRPATAAYSLMPLVHWSDIEKALDRWGWP